MFSLAGERAIVGGKGAVHWIDHERGRGESNMAEVAHQVRTGASVLTVAEACAVALRVRRERQILTRNFAVHGAGHARAMHLESAQWTAAVGIDAAGPVRGFSRSPRFFTRAGRG